MIEIIIMMIALFMGVRISVMPTEAWSQYRPNGKVSLDIDEYSSVASNTASGQKWIRLADNQPDYEEKKKLFIGDTDKNVSFVVKEGEYVITRFAVTGDVVRAWVESRLWPCSAFYGYNKKGEMSILPNGNGFYVVFEDNGDLVDAHNLPDDLSSDELTSFMEWGFLNHMYVREDKLTGLICECVYCGQYGISKTQHRPDCPHVPVSYIDDAVNCSCPQDYAYNEDMSIPMSVRHQVRPTRNY